MIEELLNMSFGHCALAYKPLAVGGTHWRHGDMFLHICHSSWVAHIGVMAVCLCRHIVGGMYWGLGSMRLHICHPSWVAYTGVMAVCSCAHVVDGMYWRLGSMLLHICHLWVAYIGDIMLC